MAYNNVIYNNGLVINIVMILKTGLCLDKFKFMFLRGVRPEKALLCNLPSSH